MLTKTVDLRTGKIDFKDLLAQVIAGTEIVFSEGNTPIARLLPIGQRVAGLHAGAITASPDFDEQLPGEFWTGTS